MTFVNLEKTVKYLKTTESLEGRGGENAGMVKVSKNCQPIMIAKSISGR